MTSINWPKVLLGGLLAGVVINSFEFVLNYFMLDEVWLAAHQGEEAKLVMRGGEIAFLNLWGFLVGLMSMFLYAIFRNWMTPSAKTALYTGALIWVFVYLLPFIKPALVSLEFRHAIIFLGVGLAATCLATLLGAWQYSDKKQTAQGATAPDD
jgi:hypothetical protein